MKRILVVFVLNILAFQVLVAQNGIDYYFPEKIEFDPDIPKPEEFLGFQVGEKHVNHGKLVGYMTALAEVSDRIQTETYGYTHEGRPLLLLTVSSPENEPHVA